jgi:hypothetical protein
MRVLFVFIFSFVVGESIRIPAFVTPSDPLHIIVLNTAKCATGNLQTMFGSLLKCDAVKEVGEQHVLRSCPDGSSVYRSHDTEATKKYYAEKGTLNNGRCVVVSAVRNPQSFLYSRFFQTRRHFLCDGSDDIPAVLANYGDWLMQFWPDAYRAPVVAGLFGLNDFNKVLERMHDGGGFLHHFPKHDGGVFGDCELIMLQVEKLSSVSHRLLHIFPGIANISSKTTDDTCPDAKDVRNALKHMQFNSTMQERLFGPGSMMKNAMDFYSKFG